MMLWSDPRWSDALSHLPDYLGSHIRVSLAALTLGLLISFPWEMLSLITVVFLLTIPVSVMRYRKLGQQDSLREAEAKPSPSDVEPPPVA